MLEADTSWTGVSWKMRQQEIRKDKRGGEDLEKSYWILWHEGTFVLTMTETGRSGDYGHT